MGITTICLGYGHSLFKILDGSILGCGATSNGQLGVDPKNVKADTTENLKHLFGRTNAELKIFGLVKLTIPDPVSLISSKYFNVVAVCNINTSTENNEENEMNNVGENLVTKNTVIYEWGECPQTVRMRQFLMQRLRNRGQREQKELNVEESNPSSLQINVQDEINNTENKNPTTTRMMSALSLTNLPSSTTQLLQRMARKRSSQSPALQQQPQLPVVLSSDTTTGECDTVPFISTNNNLLSSMKNESRDYFKIRRRCIWLGNAEKGTIHQLSAGYNHSAFVTTKGELYTWGKGLEMQLGHGDKKDKEIPTLVVLKSPYNTIKWAHVECGLF